MPAKSKSQQRFMGMVHNAQKTGKSYGGAVDKAAQTMDPKDAEDFASTKHEKLPEKAAEWARKLAYAVPAPKTHSTGKILPKTKRTSTVPSIGQRKVAPPVPPAAADAQAASAAMTPGTKTANEKKAFAEALGQGMMGLHGMMPNNNAVGVDGNKNLNFPGGLDNIGRSALFNALIGGGVGAGAGALRNQFRGEDDETSMMSDMAGYGLGGAVAGGLAGGMGAAGWHQGVATGDAMRRMVDQAPPGSFPGGPAVQQLPPYFMPEKQGAANCSGGGDMKVAPRYSSRARKGKKVMPLPHARMQKKAYTLMNNSCEMIGTIKTDRIHDGMETARAIGGGLLCDTELEKIAKLNYLQRLSAAEKRGKHAVWAVKQAFAADSAPMLTQPGAAATAADPAMQQPLPPPMPGTGEGPAGAAPMPPQAGGPSLFGKMLGGGMPMGPTGSMTSQPGSAPATPAPPAAPAMPGTGGNAGGGMAKAGAHQKQALGGLGTLLGAAGGGLMAPSGNKMEGVGRGVGKGLGWDIGGGLGSGLGAALGPAIMAAIAKHQGRQVTPEELSGAAGVGALGGYGLGGFAGKGIAGGMMGDPTWKSKEEESLKQEAALA